MKKTTLFIFTIFLLLIANSGAAELPTTVRVIYFQPLDAPLMQAKIKKLMTDVQNFYGSEMERHGFGFKTFRLETDANNKIIIHVIKGKRNLRAYTNVGLIEKELPDHLQDKFALENNIRVIFLGGARIIRDGAVTQTACRAEACAYTAFVPAESGALMPQFTVHEMGHAFGLQHHPSLGKGNFVMETLVFLNNIPRLAESRIDDYEARWLDKHKYFNQLNAINNPPIILKIHELTAAIIEDKQHVQFRVDLKNDIVLCTKHKFLKAIVR